MLIKNHSLICRGVRFAKNYTNVGIIFHTMFFLDLFLIFILFFSKSPSKYAHKKSQPNMQGSQVCKYIYIYIYIYISSTIVLQLQVTKTQ